MHLPVADVVEAAAAEAVELAVKTVVVPFRATRDAAVTVGAAAAAALELEDAAELASEAAVPADPSAGGADCDGRSEPATDTAEAPTTALPVGVASEAGANCDGRSDELAAALLTVKGGATTGADV